MKKILVILVGVLILTGCNNSKFDLDEEYYQNGGMIEISIDKINELQENEASYILFTYNPYCKFKVSCEAVFEQFTEENNMTILKVPFEKFKGTELIDIVEYAPSIILINKGKIVKYLDAESSKDYDRYQDYNKFYKWVTNYINLK